MLAILTAAALGYWANQHIGFERSEDASISLQVNAPAIAADVRWLWLTFIALCTFAVTTGRSSRTFARTVVRPWLAAFGLNVPTLPSLPTLPKEDQLVSAEYMAENYTPGPRMGSMQLMIPKPLGHNF